MKWITLGIITLIAASSAFAQEINLRVMTFNVRYGTANDGDNAWPNRKDILINCIKEVNPDLLGLQECLIEQAEYIAEKLPDYRWTGIGREKKGAGEMTAVFYRRDTITPLDIHHFWLSETPEIPASKSWDTNQTRMATQIRFFHSDTQRTFLYVNTHLDHRGEEARQKGIQVINDQINTENTALPTILTGDFNAFAQKSKAYEIAISNGFKDSWIEAPQKKGPIMTFGDFKAPVDGQDERIDWIMYKGNVNALSCQTDTYNEQGRYPSDHYPVWAELRLP